VSLLFIFSASISAQNNSPNPRYTTPKSPNDTEYGKKIAEYTTEKYFMTELVDHLPLSDKVPSPEKILGYVVGTPNKLTYTKDLYRYFRALAAASPRVRVLVAPEKSEEGREQMLVLVSDEANLARLDRYKEITAKLADPRKLSDADARTLITEGNPFYWASGSIHSPETGSPEMLMELAYRLAVEDSPFIEDIRKNMIVMMTPALEVDGRDFMVDLYNYRKANPSKPSPPLLYWGKYVAHDNNRDGLGMALALTRNQMRTFLEYHPTVLHDLHESVPYLYTMTGTGPYNAWLDPLARRVSAARLPRNRRDDEARRARRLDARFLRRLGAELHALHRHRSQRHRPFLRDVWQRRRRHARTNAAREPDVARLVSAESAVPARQLVDAQQHQHAAVGDSVRDELRREGQGPLSEQLLPEKQTLHRKSDE
jgi:hypothetical protein